MSHPSVKPRAVDLSVHDFITRYLPCESSQDWAANHNITSMRQAWDALADPECPFDCYFVWLATRSDVLPEWQLRQFTYEFLDKRINLRTYNPNVIMPIELREAWIRLGKLLAEDGYPWYQGLPAAYPPAEPSFWNTPQYLHLQVIFGCLTQHCRSTPFVNAVYPVFPRVVLLQLATYGEIRRAITTRFANPFTT